VRLRPKEHPFELPRYNYDLSRKTFVLRCLYYLNSILVHCLLSSVFLFVFIFAFIFFLFFLRVRVFNENLYSPEMVAIKIKIKKNK